MTESMFMKPAEVAELLQVSRPHVMKLARVKVDPLPIIWLNRVPRFERASVLAWIERQKNTSRCDHKFIDSNHCLKCGFRPAEASGTT